MSYNLNTNQVVLRKRKLNKKRINQQRNMNLRGFSVNPRARSNYGNSKLTIYREPGRFAANTMRANLIFQDPTGSRSVTGSSQSMNWRYRSSAYDPDPLLLTGSIPGFAELSNLYSEYCVHAIYMNLEVANQDTQAYIVVAWPGSTDNNNNSLSAADLAEYSGNILAKSKLVGTVAGTSICRMNTSALGNQLIGKRFKTDLDYSASTSTSPLAMYYMNVGVYSPLANIGFAVVTKVRLIYDIEFFKLRQLQT